jgi:hypothetical protein
MFPELADTEEIKDEVGDISWVNIQ